MLFTITFDRTSLNTPKISPFATLLVQAYYIVGQIATSGISLRLHLGKYYAWVIFFGRELRETHTSDILCISLWARKGRNNHHVVWVVNWPVNFFSLVHHSKFGYNYYATVLWSVKSELMKMYNWPRGKWSHHLFHSWFALTASSFQDLNCSAIRFMLLIISALVSPSDIL